MKMTTRTASLAHPRHRRHTDNRSPVHDPIKKFPPGQVVGNARLVGTDGDESVVFDVTRIKYGSLTTFTQRVIRNGRNGPVVTSFTKSDQFHDDWIANDWIVRWIQGMANRKFQVISEDANFTNSKSVKRGKTT